MVAIMETGLPVELGGDLPHEYARSKDAQRLQRHDTPKWEDKARFAPSLGEMVEIAENRRWEKAVHKHKRPSHFKYGFYRYDSTVAVPDGNGGFRAYDVELAINNHANKKHYLYDVVNIKENARLSTETAAEIQSRLDKKALHSPNSMAKSVANVNGESEVGKSIDQIPLRDSSNNIVGSFDRRTGEVKVLNGVDPNVAASALTHEIGHAARLHAERLAERGDRTLLDAMDKVVADAPDALKRLLVACRESGLRSTPSTVYYRPPHYWRRQYIVLMFVSG